jgi:hypothetical protein
MLDAGGHLKKLLNKDDASESMVHNMHNPILYFEKKGGIIYNCVYDPAGS